LPWSRKRVDLPDGIANLPGPHLLAPEIVGVLSSALAQFEDVLRDVEQPVTREEN